jgi:hypothetical protein
MTSYWTAQRRQWNKTVNVLKVKKRLSTQNSMSIMHILLKNKGKMKTCSDNQKVRQLFPSQRELSEMLTQIL